MTQTAAWARDVYNEGQFAYAFYVAVIHREDTNGIVLPPLYEIYPYFYFYGNDLQQFSAAKQLGKTICWRSLQSLGKRRPGGGDDRKKGMKMSIWRRV